MPRSIHPAALRRWLSPLTAALFVLVSLSGILMHGPGMHALHEGSAYLFLGACLVVSANQVVHPSHGKLKSPNTSFPGDSGEHP